MMHSNLGAGLACLGLVALLSGCDDYILLQNASGDAGLLVDGLNSSTGNAVNDGSRMRNGVGDILVNVSRFSSAAGRTFHA